ncbi:MULTISPECIES: helix-turn-helix domain-containing protein [Streptomyces]|uniref:Transcriptional regulator with XRE-family HTH domain n=1 Tax=Streptomyces clavifer TaxID=68188 RepID=A0ABS4VDS5_9ACTN|nr:MULTISPECIES: helix-turn-helix transcriptional regulator [Streptomyces]KQX79643.1 DNA-binding protein [Streptomyces sp. Root1319]KQZ20842.1 DNA-binding protein [Streptomyces sp. Root55]MBP2362074.1 transcriptional regulator with XRE-family HTH domain [Streptomyces clavifer]MDX2746548.1 helix-turn-helix transcriptional regulator [Streptomyces sp. NRRL_B-2557]MDX3064142.1 helix-turn-helix transcriptional regulator [Streptomyces sp. ND04-05B]
MELTDAIGENDDSEGAADLFRVIGRQVRLLRERADLTQRELGERLGYSEDLVRSLERGRRTPQPEFLDAADDTLGAGGLLRAATEDVARAKARARVKHPAWFRDYARLEADAVEVHEYGSHVVPGLLQTEAHARALFAMRKPLLDDATIEVRVAARLIRQELLTRWPAPILTCIIEESVLRRPIGGAEVHTDQLEKLLELGQLRSLELQVMPTERDTHAGMGGPFILLAPKGRPQVGYLEVQNVSRLVTDPDEVRILAARYGSIRAQALSPSDSLAAIKELLGAA